MQQYICVSVTTTSEGADTLCTLLGDLGIGGFEICDRRDFLDFVENCRDKYDYIDESLLNAPDSTPTVKFYLETETSRETLAAVVSLLDSLRGGVFGQLEMTAEKVLEEDWAETWKRFFHPTEIGSKILVVPEWEKAPETDRICFTINPGMVFGTGTHESTQLCIEAAEKAVTGGESVLDLGCGSGILSIVAMLLGAEQATAVDIDPKSYETANENAVKNNVRSGYAVKIGDITDDGFASAIHGKYDIVFANIVSGVIISIAPYIKKFLADDGVLITSGIINERREEVQTALEQNGLELLSSSDRKGWTCLVMKKNTAFQDKCRE